MAETARLRALRNLAGQLPVASQRIAAGQQAARDIQLQQAVAAAPAAAQVAPVAQTTGAALAGQAGAQAVQRAGQGIQQTGQIGQLGLAEQQRASAQEIAGLQAGAREQQMSNVERLARVSADAKRELYDKQMQFQRDELGRTRLNNVQLADWAALNAANEEQLRNYQQQVEKLSRRKMQAMESAQKLVNEDLEQKYRLAKQQGDQAAEREIVNIQKVIADRMQREKNEAANRAAMWTAGGTAVGAAGGAILGGTLLPGVGAVPGAIAGAGFGAAAGGLASNVLGG